LIEEVATGVPRIDYTGGGCGKLLLEPQRTNSLLQSNTFNTVWINQLGGGTITGGQINALSASDDAWKLTKDAASNRSIRQAISLSSATYAYSAFLKSGTLANAAMRVDTSSGARFMNLDLSTGTISSTSGTIVSTSIEDYGNGWYKCTMVVAESITNAYVYVGEFSGTTAGDIYCQRTQLEAGSYPTSYIPTTTTAVTRVADSASKSGISSLIGQTEGTLYWQGSTVDGVSADIFAVYSDNPLASFVSAYIDSSKFLRLLIRAGGTLVVNAFSAVQASNTNFKIAFTYKSGASKLYYNGALIVTSTTSLTFVDSFTTLELQRGFLTGKASLQTQSAMIFKTPLSDAAAIELTTI